MVTRVDNTIYSTLGDRWYDADDDPVALLRAESRLRNPWVARHVHAAFSAQRCRVLDVGCGAGFLTNDLASRGHEVTGVDASREALDVARTRDRTRTAAYRRAEAESLPFPDASFDVACAMDLLEHVENPARVVGEIGRVLRPNGLFFFHTFNRSALAWLVVIKGVEWFVKNTPRDMHVLRLFVKPDELADMCEAHGLDVVDARGSRPAIDRAFFEMLATGVVPKEFRFVFTKSLALGYTGFARKR